MTGLNTGVFVFDLFSLCTCDMMTFVGLTQEGGVGGWVLITGLSGGLFLRHTTMSHPFNDSLARSEPVKSSFLGSAHS